MRYFGTNASAAAVARLEKPGSDDLAVVYPQLGKLD